MDVGIMDQDECPFDPDSTEDLPKVPELTEVKKNDDRKVDDLSKEDREKLHKMFTFTEQAKERNPMKNMYSPIPERTKEEQLKYNNKQLILKACKEIQNYVEADEGFLNKQIILDAVKEIVNCIGY